MATDDVWLISMCVTAGAAALALGLALVPDRWSGVELRGQRAAKRRAGLDENTLLRAVWPLVRAGAYYAARLPIGRWRARQTALLTDAGQPLGLSADELAGLTFALGVVGLASAFVVSQLNGMGAGIYVVGGGLGVMLPSLWLNEQVKNRFKSINRGLPQALDLIVMSMGAGLDFPGSVRQVVERWSDKRDPLYDDLSRFLGEISLGKTRREALEDLAARAPTQLVKTFVANAIQAEQRGTPLVEILATQAEVARTRRFQTAEKIAGRAGVVVLLPLMLIFVAVLLVLFGGLIVKGFRGTLTQ
jgi:tight adherence protein C